MYKICLSSRMVFGSLFKMTLHTEKWVEYSHFMPYQQFKNERGRGQDEGA